MQILEKLNVAKNQMAAYWKLVESVHKIAGAGKALLDFFEETTPHLSIGAPGVYNVCALDKDPAAAFPNRDFQQFRRLFDPDTDCHGCTHGVSLKRASAQSQCNIQDARITTRHCRLTP